MQAAVCSSVKQSLWGLVEGLHRVSSLPWWSQSSGVTCHPRAPVVCMAWPALQDAVGTSTRREGAMWPLGPGGISRMWDVQKEGKEPWEIVNTEARRAGVGERRCLVWEVGRKGDDEGSRGGGEEALVGRVGHWEGVWQHGGVGREDGRGEGGRLV